MLKLGPPHQIYFLYRILINNVIQGRHGRYYYCCNRIATHAFCTRAQRALVGYQSTALHVYTSKKHTRIRLYKYTSRMYIIHGSASIYTSPITEGLDVCAKRLSLEFESLEKGLEGSAASLLRLFLQSLLSSLLHAFSVILCLLLHLFFLPVGNESPSIAL